MIVPLTFHDQCARTASFGAEMPKRRRKPERCGQNVARPCFGEVAR